MHFSKVDAAAASQVPLVVAMNVGLLALTSYGCVRLYRALRGSGGSKASSSSSSTSVARRQHERRGRHKQTSADIVLLHGDEFAARFSPAHTMIQETTLYPEDLLPDWLEAEMPFRRRRLLLFDSTLTPGDVRAGNYQACRGSELASVHFVDENYSSSKKRQGRGGGGSNGGENSPYTVLLLHGNPSWSFSYRNVIRALLPTGVRIIAPDLLGFGLSHVPSFSVPACAAAAGNNAGSAKLSYLKHSDNTVGVDRITLEMHVAAILTLVQTLHLQNIVIVGQDWGGPIAAAVADRLAVLRAQQQQQEAAGASPSSSSSRVPVVRGAVFLNTAIGVPRHLKATLLHRASHWPLLGSLLVNTGAVFGLLKYVQGDAASFDETRRRAYAFPLDTWRARQNVLDHLRAVPTEAGHETLAVFGESGHFAETFTGPVEVVWGTRDPVLGRAVKSMRRHFPAAPVLETDGGHFVQEQYPDEIAQAVMRVLLVLRREDSGEANADAAAAAK